MNLKLPEIPKNEINYPLESGENQKLIDSMDKKIARYLIDLNKVDENFTELLKYGRDDSKFCLKMISMGILMAYQSAFSDMLQKFVEFNESNEITSE